MKQEPYAPKVLTIRRLSYAATRRMLGICYVGTIVSICITILCTNTALSLFGYSDSSRLAWLINISGLIAIFELTCLPFDFAGFLIERIFERNKQSVLSYVSHWSRAVIKHGILLLLAICAISVFFRIAGLTGLFFYSLLFCSLIIWKQKELSAFYSKVPYNCADFSVRSREAQTGNKPVPLLIAHCSDLGFTGGIVGLPGSESIIIPAHWLMSLTDSELRCEIDRRQNIIKSGGRTKGVAVAVIFNTIGIILCSFLTAQIFSLSLNSSAGILTMSCFFTIWSFLGLLSLPYPSQLGTMEADKITAQNYGESKLVLNTIAKIDQYTECEQSRSKLVEFVFHPIPTLESRIKSFESNYKTKNGAWHCARYAIVLSLSGLGLLGRAVHCNAGKPALWAMLPAD